MIIDILFALAMIAAVFKGYSKGLVVAVFSFFAIIIGLAAALKLSATVANWLQTSVNISSKWLPFLSFIIVMIGVILLVRVGAGIIEKAVQVAFLGWVNKIAGIILYALLYTTILSILLFYGNKLHLIKEETIAASVTYSFISPFAPFIFDSMGVVFPFLKNLFMQLETFFQRFAA